MLKNWEALPEALRREEVRPYYELLRKKRGQLLWKRCFDILAALLLLLLLLLPMLVIAVLIRLDSKGPVFYRQVRVTQYGRTFRIHKFRTMVTNADKLGAAVTVGGDSRITRMGRRLRKFRLDEFPQLLDVVRGSMSFVGTRPEVEKYVACYEPEYYATLLLPAGITSETSIRYKNEEVLLQDAADPDRTYVEDILPDKMRMNLDSIRQFSLRAELSTMFRTVGSMLGKDYGDAAAPKTQT